MPFQFSCLSATERRSTAAKRDDLHSKSLFLVKNKGQWNAKSGPKQCLSQDFDFFPKKELFNLFRELLAKERSYPFTVKIAR